MTSVKAVLAGDLCFSVVPIRLSDTIRAWVSPTVQP